MSSSRNNWLHESKALLRIAGPLIVNNLSIAGMQFADAVMAGRLGAEALAAGMQVAQPQLILLRAKPSSDYQTFPWVEAPPINSCV